MDSESFCYLARDETILTFVRDLQVDDFKDGGGVEGVKFPPLRLFPFASY